MRLRALVIKELIETVRQRELLILLFIIPVVQIILLGHVVTTDVKNIPVDIINLSRDQSSEKIIRRIQESSLFQVQRISPILTDPIERFKRGEVSAVIVFRDNLSTSGARVHLPEVQILVDGVDSNTSLIAAGYFNGIVKNYLLTKIDASREGVPVENRSRIRFNPELRSINYMGPGLVALLLTMLTGFITVVSIVREKEQQTMDSLLISHLRPMEIYIGKLIPPALIGLAVMSLGIAVVMIWFGIPIRGSFIQLLAATLIYLPAILSFSLFISTVSSSQQQAMFFSWFSLVTFLLLSGFFTPLDNIPAGIRILADINPLRYFMEIIREIFLKGNGFSTFWEEIVALILITSAFLTLSLISFRRFISK